MSLDLKTLRGYPCWEFNGFVYLLLPCDGIVARFPVNADKDATLVLLEQAGLMKRFAFHTNSTPLRDGLVLYITSRCNCHCDYCEADIGSSAQDMELPVANAAFELGAWIAGKMKGRRVSVTFLGGEPTLRTDILVSFMERLRLADINANVSLATNGMLSNEDLSRLIKYENIEWRISLDIPDERYAHLDHRRGSDYSRIFNTIREVVSHGRSHVIRSTITKQTLFLMDELADRCEALGAKKIMFTPMRLAYGRSLSMPDSLPDVDEYVSAWYACHRNHSGIDVTDIHVGMMFGKRTSYCSSTFIMPDGTILPTTSEAYSRQRLHIGNVLSRDWPSVETKLNQMKQQFFLDVEENCAGCIGRNICSGGSMATELYLGTKRQGQECLILSRMVQTACERIHAMLLCGEGTENISSLPPYIKLYSYSQLKNKL